MKIAQVVESVDFHRGGKERFVGELVMELVKKGHEVSLITCDEHFKLDVNCNSNYVRGWSTRGFPIIASVRELSRNLNKRFDIVHLHYHALFGEEVALISKMHKQKLITTIHDEMKRTQAKAVYDTVLLHTISSLSCKVICLTDGMKKAIVKRGLDHNKVVIIPNAMYVNALQSQASNLTHDLCSNNCFDLLFVGRLEERKGVQYLLKSLLLLTKQGLKPTLKIIGEGSYKEKLMSLVTQYNLLPQVTFAGYLSSEMLLKSYIESKCVVIPSLYEGTPNRVAIEALALGKQIIITSIPGMEAISSQGFGLVAPPKDSDALAKVISKALLLSDGDLRALQSKSKQFAQQYDWSNVIHKIITLYRDLL